MKNIDILQYDRDRDDRSGSFVLPPNGTKQHLEDYALIQDYNFSYLFVHFSDWNNIDEEDKRNLVEFIQKGEKIVFFYHGGEYSEIMLQRIQKFLIKDGFKKENYGDKWQVVFFSQLSSDNFAKYYNEPYTINPLLEQ